MTGGQVLPGDVDQAVLLSVTRVGPVLAVVGRRGPVFPGRMPFLAATGGPVLGWVGTGADLLVNALAMAAAAGEGGKGFALNWLDTCSSAIGFCATFGFAGVGPEAVLGFSRAAGFSPPALDLGEFKPPLISSV